MTLVASLCLLVMIFMQGVGTGYLFDDFTSVVPLQQLREQPELFWQYVHSDLSGPLGRPVSIASFAIEQALFKAGPDESQVISICIHAFNSLLVFYIAYRIFGLIKSPFPGGLALIAAGIWAFSPQKVSTVLYIVQRMTMLSATFTLLAMASYLGARTTSGRRAKFALYAASAACLISAPFAKENGILALPIIAALEVFVLSVSEREGRESKLLRSVARLVLVAGTLFFLLFGFYTYAHAEGAFSLRSFDFWERLLFSPVAILDYAKQFLVPATGRMGLLHDDVVVKWKTIRFFIGVIAIIFMVSFLGLRLIQGRASIVAFAIAVFLIGHSLESSFLALELYFEHRNYLPSLGLSLLLVYCFSRFIYRSNKKKSYAAIAALVIYTLTLAFSTSSYAKHWSSYKSLLAHQLVGHPGSARAHAEYALAVARAGKFDLASRHIQEALDHSRTQKAARSFGYGDGVTLKVAAACLARRPLDEALPDLPVTASNDPIHSRTPWVLGRMVADKVCSEANWVDVSRWLNALVIESLNAGWSLRWYALRDLALLERAIGNYTMAFVYAEMALEKRPEDGMLLSIKLEAAVHANDRNVAGRMRRRMEELNERGELRPTDSLVLKQLQ